ncbi:acetylcholine receptor subunit alpha-L1-like [Patella vulgata]|uniref:acetylcholine receptor subunit alpha-L1-like n=1 Tax=Patella vulgata TaxID=6465 RepID=UPI0024A85F2A|nr:acetylcholine receptor subunit alpha-L1-like [Patella vulgata]
MKLTNFILVACVALILSMHMHSSEGATDEDVERLFQEKVKKGNSKIRPLKNQSEIVDVEMTLFMVAILDVNEVQQSVEATIWMKVRWKNELLVWDPNDYGNLTLIYPPEENIWKPDLAISNGYNELTPVGIDFVLLKSCHNGQTLWTPGQKVHFLCKIDVSKFPFDTQTCFMEFFNWAGTKEETSLKYRELEFELPNGYVAYPNSEWTVIERRSVKDSQNEYEMIRVTVVLKRKSLSLVLTVLLPVILLVFLNVFVFLLPTESGEKLSFSVTVLLSQAVFLSFISGLMPQTSDTISGLSIYISAQLVLSSLYVLITCCTLRIYHRDTNKCPLPRWFLKILCLPIHSDNCVYPVKENDGKLETTADRVTGSHISLRLDRICFWFFLVIVFLMTAIFLMDGIYC